MGLFDSVWFKCPSCGNEIEAQSKGGECYMRNYRASSVPIDVALDAEIYEPCKCGKKYKIAPPFPKDRISLSLVEDVAAGDDGDEREYD